jgi:hypothetical protein
VGTAGSAGSSGTGGSSGLDGSAGSGGTAGSAGTNGAAGADASAGGGGSSGSAGAAGADGGDAAGRSGNGGTAGGSGSSGTSGTAGAAGARDAGSEAETCPPVLTCNDLDPATSSYNSGTYVLTLGLRAGRTRPSGGTINIPVGDCSSPQNLFAGLEILTSSLRADFTESGAPTEIRPCASAELTLMDACNGSYTVLVDISFVRDAGPVKVSCPTRDGGRDGN